MTDRYDAIVLGGGVVGASTLFHLSALGCRKTLLLERGAIASGGTGKSCAIVRTHYSVLSNTELAVHSLKMFEDLATALDDPDAQSGFVNTGYIILAPEDTIANQLRENLARQRDHGADTYEISEAEARELHPLLEASDAGVIGYEPASGYADPHLTTSSFLQAARRRGAEVRTQTAALELLVDGDTVHGVRTQEGDFYADHVVSVLGPWSKRFLGTLGIDVPLETYRHTVITLKAEREYRRDLPIVKDLTVANKMYFRPESGMILAGTGDYGQLVDDPDDMDVQADEELLTIQMRQIGHRIPSFADAGLVRSWFGPYDIPPDWNPIVDSAPGYEGLHLAFGFSGHGFKLAPMVGRVLAEMVMEKPTTVDMSPYRLSRFSEGAELAGVYGIGSIS